MPFVLREENSTDNPPLAHVLGQQITEGRLVYYVKSAGRTRAIYILGEGEMDGLNKMYQRGEVIPEFSSDGSRIWRFHSGTITKKPVYRKSSSISGNTFTFASAHGFTTGQSAVVVGLTFPTGVTSKQYTVTVISPTSLKLMDETTEVAVSTTFPQISIYNPAGVGFNDPFQGRPEFFSEINYTFSGISYVEINMTADMSAFDDEEPSGFKFLVRGKRLQNYTAAGLLADANGTAYPNQNSLPEQTKFFSDNNALAAVDVALNNMKMKHNRIDWASFVVFRDRCDGVIPWEAGLNQSSSGFPTWVGINSSGTSGNLTENPLGTIYKSGGAGWGDAGTITLQQKATGIFSISGVYRSGQVAIGVTKVSGIQNYTDMYYSLVIDEQGNITMYKGSEQIGTASTTPNKQSVFKITVDPTTSTDVTIRYFENDAALLTHRDEAFNYSLELRGSFAAKTVGSRMSDLKLLPLSGTGRNSERYNADIVFPSEVPSSVAFEQLFSRAPGCHWQDVNGKIVFIAYPGINKIVDGIETTETIIPENYSAGERVLVKTLEYDPKMTYRRSNIVQNSFSYYIKPVDEKINFVRLEYRNIDDEFFKKDYVLLYREEYRDITGGVVDSGIIQIGVASQSLSERIGEATLRVGSDLDLFVQLKGMPECYQISKGDIVALSHDVPDWDIYNSKLFIVIEEHFESTINALGEKTFLLQIYRPDFYSDTDHGQILALTPTDPVVGDVPPILSFSVFQSTEQNGTETSYKLNGELEFDTAYGKKQIARVYYRHETGDPNRETILSVEQLNAGTPTQEFTITNLLPGVYYFRIVTESEKGKISLYQFYHTSLVETNLYPRRELVEWITTGLTQDDGVLTRTSSSSGWDNAFARGIRRLANSAIASYLEFTIGDSGNYRISLSNVNSKIYGLTDGTNLLVTNSGTTALTSGGTDPDFEITVNKDRTGLKTLEIRKFGALLIPAFSINTDDVITIRMDKRDRVRFCHLKSGELVEVEKAVSTNQKYPLYIGADVFSKGSSTPKCFVYGNMESSEGVKLHWTSMKSITLDLNDDLKRESQSGVGSSWAFPNDSGSFSLEYLDSDGTIDFVASETTTNRMVGLAYTKTLPSQSGETSYKTTDYTLYMTSKVGANSPVMEVRQLSDVPVFSITYAEGDRFGIQRLKNEIYYIKNGLVFYKSLVPVNETLDKLYVKTDFYEEGSTIKNLRLHRIGKPLNATFFGSALVHQVDAIGLYSRIDVDDVFFQLSMNFRASDYSNTGSITRASVKIKNKFGQVVADFPSFTFMGSGIIGQGFYPRKYADPDYEAIFEIRVATQNGNFSSPVYYTKYRANQISLTEPPLLNKALSPQDLTAIPINDTQVSLQWANAADAKVEYLKDNLWTEFSAETVNSPYTASILKPLTYYDFRISKNTYKSNAARVKTLQQSTAVSPSPAPTNLTATQNTATSVNLGWVRNASNNTGVELYIDNVMEPVLGASITNYTKTGLTTAAHNFKVRNIFPGSQSEFSTTTLTLTQTSVPSTSAPYGLSATAISSRAIVLNWKNGSGTLNNSIERSLDEGSWVTIITLAPSQTTYQNNFLMEDTGYYYRVSNLSAPSSYTNTAFDSTFPNTTWEPGCIYLDSLVLTENGELFANQIKEDMILKTVTKNGISSAVVKSVMLGETDVLHIVTTESGKTIKCSPSHPFIIDKDLNVKIAVNIKKGDSLLTFTKSENCVIMDKVYSVETLTGEFSVVIYELDCPEHTFIAQDIVHHNVARKPLVA